MSGHFDGEGVTGMNKSGIIFATLAVFALSAAHADSDYKVATVISAATLDRAMDEAPPDSVSDQPLSHVESAEGRLGIGVVHRPVIEAGGPIEAIQHHKQSEVYRVMSGSGTLVTSASMAKSTSIDPDGYIVRHLTGPSDQGVIEKVEQSQLIGEGDVVIIPAGVAHGFSEITAPITYMVVRIDPERLVALK
jgi:mannose-6-phosphate isomerase-like protein (cupin superfamily)